MQSFDLNCKGWDFEHLEVEQAIELLASMHAHILLPSDTAARAAYVHAFSSLLQHLFDNKNDENVGVQFLKSVASTIPKKQKTSLARIDQTTSYICRLITHHHSDLDRRASIRKAQYLVEKSAEGKRRGFSKKSLEDDWKRAKILAPLITANRRSGRRVLKRINRDPATADFGNKVRARLTELVVDAPIVFAEAIYVQDLLSSYEVWGGTTPLNADTELFLPKDKYAVAPKKVRFKPFNDKQLALLHEEYWDDRKPIKDFIKSRESS